MMVQLWSDLTPEEQARYEDREQLLAQLAAITADRDALALELSHLRPEWQAMRAERDAAVAALALATNSEPGRGKGGTWTTQ